jgi:hypothetical protein
MQRMESQESPVFPAVSGTVAVCEFLSFSQSDTILVVTGDKIQKTNTPIRLTHDKCLTTCCSAKS